MGEPPLLGTWGRGVAMTELKWREQGPPGGGHRHSIPASGLLQGLGLGARPLELGAKEGVGIVQVREADGRGGPPSS